MQLTEAAFVGGLLLAFLAGLTLQVRTALAAAAAITLARYALAVATWGFEGPNDEPPLQYAAFALLLTAAVTLAATVAGLLTAAALGRARKAKPPSGG